MHRWCPICQTLVAITAAAGIVGSSLAGDGRDHLREPWVPVAPIAVKVPVQSATASGDGLGWSDPTWSLPGFAEFMQIEQDPIAANLTDLRRPSVNATYAAWAGQLADVYSRARGVQLPNDAGVLTKDQSFAFRLTAVVGPNRAERRHSMPPAPPRRWPR